MSRYPAAGSIQEAHVLRYADGRFVADATGIIRESSLNVIVNDAPLATIACLGLHTEELAVGFLRSEGILASRDDLKGIDKSENGLTVYITMGSWPASNEKQPFAIASSGARGQTSEALDVAKPKVIGAYYAPERVLRLMDDMVGQACHHRITRGAHCAALADENGLIALREDIGRHNCLDMLVGYAFQNGIDASDKLLLRTGRMSAEIVRKAWRLGTRQVASLSVPTATAIELAEKAGIMLMGAVRNKQMIVYTQTEQIGAL